MTNPKDEARADVLREFELTVASVRTDGSTHVDHNEIIRRLDAYGEACAADAVAALRHEAYRSHDRLPEGCDGCAEVERLLSPARQERG